MTTNASRFGLALVGSIAGHIMRDRVFLWMGVVGLVALVVGLAMDVIAQRRGHGQRNNHD